MTIAYYTSCKKLLRNEYMKTVSSLPIAMQYRVKKYRRWEDAHAYLYGRLLLKYGASQLGYNDSLALLEKTEFGKPYLPFDPLSFNISHSEEYVVCVISDNQKCNIGIDIEKIKPINKDHFNGIFTTQEKNNITRYEHFYKYWTRKEAIVKADGRGLQIPLNTIDVTNLRVKLDDDDYYLNKLDIDKNYSAHIASSIEIKRIDKIYCSLELIAIKKFSDLVKK